MDGWMERQEMKTDKYDHRTRIRFFKKKILKKNQTKNQ